MWAPEDCGPASERPNDVARHILGFFKAFSSRIQDPNFCWNWCQSNFKQPVRYLQCLSKLLLFTLNSNAESSKQEQSLQAPKQRSGTKAVQQRRCPLQLVLHNILLEEVKHMRLGELGKDRASDLLLRLCSWLWWLLSVSAKGKSYLNFYTRM